RAGTLPLPCPLYPGPRRRPFACRSRGTGWHETSQPCPAPGKGPACSYRRGCSWFNDPYLSSVSFLPSTVLSVGRLIQVAAVAGEGEIPTEDKQNQPPSRQFPGDSSSWHWCPITQEQTKTCHGEPDKDLQLGPGLIQAA